MNETIEQQIKRLEFCRDCIVLDSDAGREEYARLERIIEELKQLETRIKTELKHIEELQLLNSEKYKGYACYPTEERTIRSAIDGEEDAQSKEIKDHLYRELNEEAKKATYIKYSPDKLVRGQFGKLSLGPENSIEYVLLSDRFLNREFHTGYFYLLKIQTISCGGFFLETGERAAYCKVIEMEDIDEAKALERYNQFLKVWKA